MILSEETLFKVLPQLKGITTRELESAFSKIFLEVEGVTTEGDHKVYELKQIGNFCDLSDPSVLAWELGLVFNVIPLLELPKRGTERATSKLQLGCLLPIFRNLRDNWERSIVSRLSQFGYLFEQVEDEVVVSWPPYFKKDHSLSFNEILNRLIEGDQSTYLIDESKELLSTTDKKDIEQKTISLFKDLRAYLREKGFVEVNTPKTVRVDKNLGPTAFLFEYSTDLTLRDQLHYSLVEGVLLESLNSSRKTYPVFELSFCPWSSKWLLGLASIVPLKDSEDDGALFYNLEGLKEISKELCRTLFDKDPEIRELGEKTRYYPNVLGANSHQLLVDDREVGSIFIFRRENLEVRKKEIVSLQLSLSRGFKGT
ncbi:phenylalanyl-tRNA synthetase subunit beta [Candidatus Mycoplasma haematolamae str. Purdue]|uniref:Phenylalanyl-tRNA synthetase subunit beta n=1 Tax=Mycoplasma haematolamae (strain Purdue) TaxID=1212765 RepID=I7B8S2_MYCHA|nr:hypothetical protein [Candidatus Mycoplasma haematolamae]AFO51630.1 phenylalanyl-tRNA synthetase subunit beta [Candidatus Mycoplasma haematolamae str. Purdue]